MTCSELSQRLRALMAERPLLVARLSPAVRLQCKGLFWLIGVGFFFLLSYTFANTLAELRQVRTSFVFDWERLVPFRPWTIVPYWSLIPAYILSFFAFDNARRLDRHARRLLLCQALAVLCFLLMPLRFSYTPPRVDGFFGLFFNLLYAFDLPYNQAPSLHIALLVLLRARWSPPGLWRAVLDVWVFLVGLSALTTWQHHVIDVPAGAALGLFVLWCVPDEGPSIWELWRERRRQSESTGGFVFYGDGSLALLYFGGAIDCFGAVAVGWGLFGAAPAGLWFLLLWGGLALVLVGLIYWKLGPRAFQKRDGRLSPAVSLLFLPYLMGVWLNARWETRRGPAAWLVARRVWIGRMPERGEIPKVCNALLDLTAEMDAPVGGKGKSPIYVHVPMLDSLAPSPAQLAEAALRLDALHQAGRTILVCGARGSSRAPLVVAVWLAYRSGASLSQALRALLRRRPGIVLRREHLAAARFAVHKLQS